MKEGEREREGERRERERGGESAEAGVPLTATPLPCPPERSDGKSQSHRNAGQCRPENSKTKSCGIKDVK